MPPASPPSFGTLALRWYRLNRGGLRATAIGIISLLAFLLVWHLLTTYCVVFFVRFTNVPSPLAVASKSRPCVAIKMPEPLTRVGTMPNTDHKTASATIANSVVAEIQSRGRVSVMSAIVMRVARLDGPGLACTSGVRCASKASL